MVRLGSSLQSARLVSGREDGAIMSVGLSEQLPQFYIEKVAASFGHCDLTVACVKSHTNVFLSGGAAQISTHWPFHARKGEPLRS